MGGKKCRAKEDGSKENKVRGLSGQAEVWPQLEERMRLMWHKIMRFLSKLLRRRKSRVIVGRVKMLIKMQERDRFDDVEGWRSNMKKRQDELDRGEDLWRLTSRKVLMLGILFSSMRSRKAFSWLLQYSPYTEKLSLCKKVERNTGQVCRPGTWYNILLASWQPWEMYCDHWQGLIDSSEKAAVITV